tara:strand:+ start:1407 stop:1961 length:555 start_codon:yes stop_codon:yes gene_type:complete
MSCSISRGRQEVCKDSVGGLQGVYFINFESGSFSNTGDSSTTYGEITSLSGSTAYFYELKGTSAYTETVNSSRENGTTFYSQETTLNLKKLTNEMTTQLKLLAAGRPQIIVWTNAGDALLVGEQHGADLTAGTIQTGGALGDLYGYSLTFTAEEKGPARFISGSSADAAFDGLLPADRPTIVYS